MTAGSTPASITAPLTQVWNGSSWTSLATPDLVTPTASLNSVSCPATTVCTAVGVAEGPGILAMSFDGTRWHIVRVSRSGTLSGIWCTLATRCMAVGGYLNQSDNFAVLAQAWHGATRGGKEPELACGLRVGLYARWRMFTSAGSPRGDVRLAERRS